MTLEHDTEAAAPPPPRLCSKCGERETNGPKQYWCSHCKRAAGQQRYVVRKQSAAKRCPTCGVRLPHKTAKGRCPQRRDNYYVARGREKLNERWPGYGDAITDERILRRIGEHAARPASLKGLPPPSRVFPGLSSMLDARLRRDGYDKNVALCRAVAAQPVADQRGFLDLYLENPADAARWVALPDWKRLLRRGDDDDRRVWKFFTMQRLNMERAARDATAWSLASQGTQLLQMFGVLLHLTPAGARKLCDVMLAYAGKLSRELDPGDVTTPPWEPHT